MNGFKGYRVPPLTNCRGCGKRHRNWSAGALCGGCIRDVFEHPPTESLRDYRKRVKGEGA